MEEKRMCHVSCLQTISEHYRDVKYIVIKRLILIRNLIIPISSYSCHLLGEVIMWRILWLYVNNSFCTFC